MNVKLTKNLRREILRGHPWVYKEGVVSPVINKSTKASLCEVADSRGFLAWAIFDPHGPLRLRILSTDQKSPTTGTYKARFDQAFQKRLGLEKKNTDAFRLFNGEGDLLPGLICDVYSTCAVIQFDGQGPKEFWDKNMIAEWILSKTEVKTVFEKSRRNEEKDLQFLGGKNTLPEALIKENGAIFKVNIETGQKTGFFLDQRDNREYVKSIAGGKSFLNLFSYTGGFSISAGLGGAKKVESVDISKLAIAGAEENWRLNSLKEFEHIGYAADVFEFMNEKKEKWDHIIVDPPSMSHSEVQKSQAKTKYIDVFSKAAKKVNLGGELSLSSCSSHISFNDFSEIVTESLSIARRRGQVFRLSGQASDHPYPHACQELRYLKFIHLVLD